MEWFTEDPKELIDQRIDFLVKIDRALDLPEDLCRDVYVEYNFYLDQTNYRTETCKGINRNPEFNYVKHHNVPVVTSMLVDYLEKEVMRFRVYGFADVKKSTRVKARPSKKANVSADQSTNDSSADISVQS